MTWLDKHKVNCAANHQEHVRKMETQVTVDMFKRSEKLYIMKYEYYAGNGDSKTFSTIKNFQQYNEVQKKQCIGICRNV